MAYDNDAAMQLHHRLLKADPLATSEMVELLLPLVLDYLKGKFPKIENDLLLDATTSALLNYGVQPQKFDASRSNLFTYLRRSADGDLRNELAKQRRHSFRHVSLEAVALSSLAGNINIEEQVIARQEAVERITQWQTRQAQLNQAVTDQQLDGELLALMQARVRNTAEYARVLGITDLPIAEQRAIVKRHKDRLQARLRRKVQEQEQE